MPTGSAVVVSEAAPPLTVWGLPTGEPPLSNCTVPERVPESVELTVALSVTEVPESCGLAGVGVANTVVVEFKAITV